MSQAPLISFSIKKFFAISLQDSRHRRWSNQEGSSEIRYNWSDVEVDSHSSKEVINITVAQRYSESSVTEVQDIADGIYYYNRLKRKDGVLGLNSDREVGKVGYVVNKEKTANDEVSIYVDWFEGIDSFDTGGISFFSSKEIFKLNRLDIYELVNNAPSFKKVLDIAEGYFASVNQYVLPDPLYKYNDQNKEPGGEVELFYGTTRNKTGSNDVNKYYGRELAELQLGICKVSIPPGHKQGEMERPRKLILWLFNENKNDDIILSSINELDTGDFYTWLNKAIMKSNSKAALIFIHGYNTTFSEAAWRTGQIAYDIPFNTGVCGFFSWPSTGGTIDYGRDMERADANVSDCANFIEEIVNKTQVNHLHFIGHSMGNRILTKALNKLAEKSSFKSKINIVSQIVLAAPDIDKDVFNKEILPVFKSIGDRRTLYASDKDKALKLSNKLRTGLTRIGEAGDNIYIADGLDTVDASNVKSDGNHHSYIFETKELLADLFTLITSGAAPINRRLREIEKDALTYWLFRE